MPTTPNQLIASPAQDFTRYIRDAVVISDANFTITHWNEAAEKLYGWKSQEALGKNGLDLLKTEFPEADKEVRLSQIQNSGYYRGEGIQSCKDGSRIHVEVDSIVLKDAKGQITGYLSFNRDITDKKLAAEKLADHQFFLEALTDNITSLVAYWDTQLRCRFANKAYGEWFGHKSKDLLGKSIHELLDKDILAQNLPLIQRVLAGESQSFARVLTDFEGNKRDKIIQYLPHYRGKDIDGFFVLIFDVTNLKDAERRLTSTLNIQKAITNHSAFALIQTDTQGTIQFINPAAEQMLGYSADELNGKHTPALFHDLNEVVARAKEFTLELGRAVEPGFETFVVKSDLGLPNEHEWTYIHKSGKRFPVLLGVTAIRNSEGIITGYLGTAADVSKRIQLESHLRKAIEVAEKANQAKSDFLATMSHEIRTPMNGVLGMIHAMAESNLNEDQRDLLLTMQQSGELLLSVINDILDFSKIEAGRMEVNCDPVNIHKLLVNSLALMKGQAEKKHLRLRLDSSSQADTWVKGDQERIKQVLFNLIGNAIKFTHQGGVTVQLYALPETIRISIIDTGMGIQQVKQGQIFERFTQADTSSTRRHGGTGLGLAISKHLVELMGGRIGFSSQEKEGSTFWFELPICPPQTELGSPTTKDSRDEKPAIKNLSESRATVTASKESSWSPVASRCLRVLLAEDNVVNQKVALRMLQKMQCEVVVAKDGNEAFEMATSQVFNLVLMDCQMPNMDGFEATRKIREWESQHPKVDSQGRMTIPRLSIVALTAGAMTDEKANCFSCGMDGFMAKPFKPEDMQRLIYEQLQSIEAR